MKLYVESKNMISSKITEKDRQNAKLKSVCQEFESVFISYLLKGMRKTIPNNNISGDGFSREVYTSMMDEEVARTIAKGPGIGLAKVLYRKFSDDKNI